MFYFVVRTEVRRVYQHRPNHRHFDPFVQAGNAPVIAVHIFDVPQKELMGAGRLSLHPGFYQVKWVRETGCDEPGTSTSSHFFPEWRRVSILFSEQALERLIASVPAH